MKNLDYNNIDSPELRNCINILYGAGQNGKRCLKLFEKFGIEIKGFYDDDSSRWNEQFFGYIIISKNDLDELLKREKVNFILSNIYVNNSYKNLLKMGVKENNIFSMLEFINEWDTKTLNLNNYMSKHEIKDRIQIISSLFKDNYSKQYFDIITDLLLDKTNNLQLIKRLSNLFCEETQYFLDSFRYWLNNKIILDIGAYTGDSLIEIYKKSILPKHVYSFEADYNNYLKLLKNIKLIIWKNRITCINKAVWNKEEKLYLKNNRFNTKVFNINELGGGIVNFCSVVQ